MSNLPATQDASLALGGQAALFDDPDGLLVMEPALLRQVAVSLGRSGGSILSQVRRAAGLVAWAGWHRFNAKDYEAFAAGLASDLGIETQTLRAWRRAVIENEGLAKPAVAAARTKEATRKRRSEPVRDTAITPTKVIPVDSTEARDSSSEDGERDRATGPAPTTSPSSDLIPEGVSEPLVAAPSGLIDDVPGSPDPAFQKPLNPPELVDAEPVNLVDAFYALLDVLPPDALWYGSSDDQRETLAFYVNDLREVKAEAKRAQEATEPAPKRRQGTITTQADRAKAKLEAVPDPVVDPEKCDHPKAKQQSLGYMRICGVCKAKVE